MNAASIEHVNITVSNPEHTAHTLCQIFDWQIRWSGPAKAGGHTVHVGNQSDYLAVYALPPESNEHTTDGRLNHVGVVVDDLDATEARVREQGFEPFNHGSYEPGRRFYFLDRDGIEFEVVNYPT